MVSESTDVTKNNTVESFMEKNSLTKVSPYFPSNLLREDDNEETRDYVEFQIHKKLYPRSFGVQTEYKGETQLIDTIRLHIPEGIQQPNSAQWESQTLDTGVSALANSFSSLTDFTNLSKVLSTAASDAAGEGLGQRRIQRRGRAENANKFLLFNGINFRSFQFQYELIPRSLEESKSIQKIISLFRIGMLPDKIDATYYDIPHTFKISYSDPLSKSLHSFKDSVLTECNITYGADGKFSLTTSDYPTNVQLQLTFQEIDQVTRSDVLEGF